MSDWCDDPPGSRRNWYRCVKDYEDEPVPLDIITTTSKPRVNIYENIKFVVPQVTIPTTSTTPKPLSPILRALNNRLRSAVEEKPATITQMPKGNMTWAPSLKCFEIPTLPAPDKWDDAFKTKIQVVILISLFVFLVGRNPSHAVILGVLSMCIKGVNLIWVLFIGAAYQAYHTKSWLMFVAMLFVLLSLCGQG